MIKFGWRYSLLYPSLFILFILLRRLVKIFLEVKNKKFSFLMIFLLFVFESIIGIICLCYQKRKNGSIGTSKFMGITLTQKNNYILNRPDSNFKIIILIFFASYFQIVGAISRRYITYYDKKENIEKDIYDEFHAKYRSCEIIISSILCYFTLQTKIYRHHMFSLIIITICLIIVFLNEILLDSKYSPLNILITVISSFCRTFLDIIEKYLFSIDFIDIFKLIIFEGIIDLIFASSLFFFPKPQNELKQLFNETEIDKYLCVGLLILYAILSGLKNVYRRYTVKEFTPMTRALAESVLDPFLIIYGSIQSGKNLKDYIVTLICSFIMVFCSCVYNEIFVLYCCGLEYNTHLEVVNQSIECELSYNSTIKSNIDDHSVL